MQKRPPPQFESPANPNWWAAALQISLHWSVILAYGLVVGVILPRFARIAMEWDLPMSARAVMAFNLSLATERGGWFLLPFLAIFDAAMLLIMRGMGQDGAKISNLFTAVVVIGMMIVLLLVGMSVFWQVVTVIQHL